MNSVDLKDLADLSPERVGEVRPNVGHPILKLKDFNELLKREGGAQAYVKVMERSNVSQEDIQKVIAATHELGFSLSEIEKFTLKVMYTEFVINEMRDSLLVQVAQKHQVLLDAAKQCDEFVISNFKAHVTAELNPILDRSASLHNDITADVMQLETLLSQLTLDGPVVEQFSKLLLKTMSNGVQEQVIQVHSSMNDVLELQAQKIDELAREVQKIQEIKIDQLAANLSKQLVEEVNQRFRKTQALFDASSAQAEKKFEALTARAEKKFEAVIEKAEGAITGRFWIERFKYWGTSLVLTSIVNICLFHYFL